MTASTIQKGNLVTIDFTGKDVTTGKVFDTTSEKTAKDAGLFSEQHRYVPALLQVGSGEILPGIDAVLSTMKVGETKTITLEPKDAFGERNPALVKVLPLNEFKKHNVPAVPGTIVNANDAVGKVQSVSGGRVRVDFNPDLAGRTVEYTITIVKQIVEPAEQLTALVEKVFPAGNRPVAERKGEIVEISGPAPLMARVADRIPAFSSMVLAGISGVEKVVARSEYEGKKPAPAEK